MVSSNTTTKDSQGRTGRKGTESGSTKANSKMVRKGEENEDMGEKRKSTAIKRKGKIRKLRLAKLEKQKARNQIRMENTEKSMIGVSNGRRKLLVVTMNVGDIRNKETREILAKG